MKTALRRLLPALTFTALAGCMVGPDHRSPEPILPDRWHPARDPASQLQPLDQATLMMWWKTFNDPLLTGLIEEARRQNLDLKIAYARIEQGRSEQNANRADLFPRIGAVGAGARASNVFPVTGPNGNAFDYFLTGFDAIWEIDVFGRLRRRLESAQALTAAAAEDYRQAFLVMAAEIGRQYINYRGLQQTRTVIEATLNLLDEKATLIGHRINDGLTTRDELDRVNALQSSFRAELKTLQASLTSTRHQIEFLLGKKPEALQIKLGAPMDIPAATERRLLTQPATTLRYRPDVREAEQQLASATAMQGAAIAELFPKISITAFLGLHNSDLENLFRSSAFAWASAASISQPLFNFGKIRAGIDLADARQREASLNYEKTVLTALHECETGFAEFLKEAERRDEINQSLTHLQAASQLADLRFQNGLGTRQSWLDAEVEANLEQIHLIQSRTTLTSKLIALYKALGGAGLEPVRIREEPLRPWG